PLFYAARPPLEHSERPPEATDWGGSAISASTRRQRDDRTRYYRATASHLVRRSLRTSLVPQTDAQSPQGDHRFVLLRTVEPSASKPPERCLRSFLTYGHAPRDQ